MRRGFGPNFLGRIRTRMVIFFPSLRYYFFFKLRLLIRIITIVDSSSVIVVIVRVNRITCFTQIS